MPHSRPVILLHLRCRLVASFLDPGASVVGQNIGKYRLFRAQSNLLDY